MADRGDTRRSGLGRGLDDLLAESGQAPERLPSDGLRSDAPGTEPLETSRIPSEAKLLEFYEVMLTGRLFETKLQAMSRTGRLSEVVVPAVGQEAAMAGFAGSLGPEDVFGGTHRDLVAQLARGSHSRRPCSTSSARRPDRPGVETATVVSECSTREP